MMNISQLQAMLHQQINMDTQQNTKDLKISKGWSWNTYIKYYEK